MKKENAFKKIDRKIYLVFLAVVAIAFFNAVFSSYTILQSQRTSKEIVSNMNPSMEALSQLNLLVTKSRMLTTNWVYLPSNSLEKEVINNLNNNDYAPLKIRLQSLMKKWSNNKMISDVNGVLTDYDKLKENQQSIMKRLASFDDYQDPMKKFEALEILESTIIPNSESIDLRLKNIIMEQKAETKVKQDQMLQQLNTLMIVVFGIAILIVGSLFFAAFVLSRSFIVPVMRVREIILDMSKGRLPEYRMRIPKNAVGEMLMALKLLTESAKRTSHFAEEIGKGNLEVPFEPLSDDDEHGHALLAMRKSIKAAGDLEAEHAWINEGLARLNNIMRSTSDDFTKLLDNIINLLAEYLNVQQSAIFLLNNDNMEEMHIQLGAHYALNNKLINCKRFELKEGLVGQAIASNRLIDIEDIADPFFTIDMGLGQSTTCNLMIVPLATSGKVVGAIAVASLKKMSAKQKELIQKIAEPVAASLYNVRANLITTQLLEESRKQADELAAQEQELRTINQQLTKKSLALVSSEEELRTQQNELKQVNSRLKEKAQLLEENNLAIEDARQSLFFKAEQLEQSNKYKSAFLANMSHELRTPLNSILILAKILADNKNNTLNEKQIEHANVIYKSGSDLLELINDILDLSKVEAGKLELQSELFSISEMADDMQLLFGELALDKQITFNISYSIPKTSQLNTDKGRVEQILKNLISNALKFTYAGGEVNLLFYAAPNESIFKNAKLLGENNVLAITVQDNGIGIPKEKQSLVFEAFKQADGSTSRSYGGTGLGLSICLELAQLLGGEIQLKSEAGKGSEFILYIPFNNDFANHDTQTNNQKIKLLFDSSNGVEKSTIVLRDDRGSLVGTDKKVLIIEDDYIFAQMLVNKCHLHGMKAIVATQGDVGLAYTKYYSPHAIILDMRLPVMDGWTVLQHIKSDDQLKHIPIHVVSSTDKKILSNEMGAESFCRKPAGSDELNSLFKRISDNMNFKIENILAFGKNSEKLNDLLFQISNTKSKVYCEYITEYENCLSKLSSDNNYKCIIIDQSTKINDEEQEFIITATNQLNIPLIYLDGNPDECLREITTVLNGATPYIENNDSTSQHLTISLQGDSGNRMKEMLNGKTVLLVDDDMRNIYSMTNIMEQEGMIIIGAINGQEALDKLNTKTVIDIILMDIMMPGMNGYEAMAEIKKNSLFDNIPIIALTANAMNGDREKCIAAGASDYITKPVNITTLLSLMQAWLYK